MLQTINETYIELNSVPTKISTIGKTIGDAFEVGENLVIIIPGNPGINSFYDKFAKRIHEKLKCSVWCVGHAGHNLSQPLKTVPNYKDNTDLYGLKGQVQNKVNFFAKYIPENAKIHLIGHSIGSYMVLELLENPSLSKRINHSYLLFPTIENMANSKNGKILTNYVKYVVWLAVLLSGLFMIFPRFIQTALIHAYMRVVGIPNYNCENIRQLIKPSVLKRVFHLAYEEMDQVLERNNLSIKNNETKINLLYGKFDGWTPMSYYNNIKTDFPNINAEVTTINHAFVLKSSYEVADIVSEKITNPEKCNLA
ncbi:lipid droplet-associated hydrolase isoform X2 [Diorhabda carinulata]|uniref:lipid droplet-associated hydrolase isoform X2 n=1 Tax=Diorhabda carinulata TaxID=1163345 RepID=UPI0025A248D0|nr:lipid droplet-associated hydrolase isoform X2 [Diorhabda carinulata]